MPKSIEQLLAEAHGSLDRANALSPAQPQRSVATEFRAKYPGAYDDMGDDELTQRVLAKYPNWLEEHTGDHYTGPDTFMGGATKEFAKTMPRLLPALASLGLASTGVGIPAAAAVMAGSTAAGHGVNALAGNDENLGDTLKDTALTGATSLAVPYALKGLASGARSLFGKIADGGENIAGYLRDLPGAGPKVNVAADMLERSSGIAKRFRGDVSPAAISPLAEDVGPARAQPWKSASGFGDSAEGFGYEPSPVDPTMPNSSGYKQGGGFGGSAEGVGYQPSPVDPTMPNTSGYQRGGGFGEPAAAPGSPYGGAAEGVVSSAEDLGPRVAQEPEHIRALKTLLGDQDPQLTQVHSSYMPQSDPSAGEVDNLVSPLVKASRLARGESAPISDAEAGLKDSMFGDLPKVSRPLPPKFTPQSDPTADEVDSLVKNLLPKQAQPAGESVDAISQRLLGTTDTPDLEAVDGSGSLQTDPTSADADAIYKTLFPSRAPAPAAPTSPAITDPSRMLPARGETLPPAGSKLLRPNSNDLDLLTELAQQSNPGARITAINSDINPTGDAVPARAYRQRQHISKTYATKGLKNASKKAAARD